MIGWSQCV